MAKLNQAKTKIVKLSQAKLIMAKLNYVKLNHSLNIYCKFLNFICQMYLNIILASKTF